MGFKNNAVVSVVYIDKDKKQLVNFYDKYADIYVISRKYNKLYKTYEIDFSGKVRCLGYAFEKLTRFTLKENQKITLLNVEVSNKYDKEKKYNFVNFACFDLEIEDNSIKDIELLDEQLMQDDDLPF